MGAEFYFKKALLNIMFFFLSQNQQLLCVCCINKAKQMANSLSLLPDLELQLFDDSEVRDGPLFFWRRGVKNIEKNCL